MPAKPTKTAKASTDAPNLEGSLAELESIVERLEQGDLSLEDSLKEFERGIALTRTAQEALSSAEQKVKILMESQGKQQLEDFAPLDDD